MNRTRDATRILVDLSRMQPGSSHGGIKPCVLTLLEALVRLQRSARPRFEVVSHCKPAMGNELPVGIPRASETETFDVLYSPLGYSPLMSGNVPAVALVVDLLHRELPCALPVEEVMLREEQYQGLIRLPHVRLQCISSFTRASLKRHLNVPEERCFVTRLPIHNRLGSATERSGRLEWAAKRNFFFYPANFWPHKNHEILLIAFHKYLRTSKSPWELRLSGHEDARTASVREMARGLGLGEWVRFEGFLDNASLARLWRMAGALVYPSLHEGFGIPLVEAMHFGVPILASACTAIPETVGDAAILIDGRSPDQLAAGLQRMASDPDLRENLVLRGRQRLQTFSISDEVEKLAVALEAALEILRK